MCVKFERAGFVFPACVSFPVALEIPLYDRERRTAHKGGAGERKRRLAAQIVRQCHRVRDVRLSWIRELSNLSSVTRKTRVRAKNDA